MRRATYDCLVTKLNAAGTGTVYSTIIGNGSGFIIGNGFAGTQANAIAVTSDGKPVLPAITTIPARPAISR